LLAPAAKKTDQTIWLTFDVLVLEREQEYRLAKRCGSTAIAAADQIVTSHLRLAAKLRRITADMVCRFRRSYRRQCRLMQAVIASNPRGASALHYAIWWIKLLFRIHLAILVAC